MNGRHDGADRPADPLPHTREAPPAAPPEPAPPFGRWELLYALVVAELAAMILFCGWIARARP